VPELVGEVGGDQRVADDVADRRAGGLVPDELAAFTGAADVAAGAAVRRRRAGRRAPPGGEDRADGLRGGDLAERVDAELPTVEPREEGRARVVLRDLERDDARRGEDGLACGERHERGAAEGARRGDGGRRG